LTLNGTGFGSLISGGFAGLVLPRGALTATGNSSWNGNIILSTSPVVINTNNFTLAVNGIISGTDLTKVGANTLTLNAADTFTGTPTVSAGAVTLANAHTYSGATTVGTTANLTVNSFGTLPGTSAVSVSVAGTLQIDNGTINLVNRLNDAAAITLTGATF